MSTRSGSLFALLQLCLQASHDSAAPQQVDPRRTNELARDDWEVPTDFFCYNTLLGGAIIQVEDVLSQVLQLGLKTLGGLY